MPTTHTSVLDFTFDGNKVTLLEMGAIPGSNVEEWDRLQKAQSLPSFKEIYLESFKQDYPDAIHCETYYTYGEDRQTYAVQFTDFKHPHLTARCSFTDPLPIVKILFWHAILGANHYYARPVVISLGGILLPPEARRAFDFLFINQRNTFDIPKYRGLLFDACQDKVLFYQFANSSGLCPKTLLLDLRNLNQPALLEFLSENDQFQHFVVKPTNLSEGRGVEIITKNELIAFVSSLENLATTLPANKILDKRLKHWSATIHKGENFFCLVQTCQPSKLISYENENYRPTGRVIIEASFDENDANPCIELRFLGKYWQFPHANAQVGFSNESIKSSVLSNSPTLHIAPDDWEIIELQLRTLYAPVLLQLYKSSHSQLKSIFNTTAQLQSYYHSTFATEKPEWPIVKSEDALQNFHEAFVELARSGDAYNNMKDFNHFVTALTYPDFSVPVEPIREESFNEYDRLTQPNRLGFFTESKTSSPAPETNNTQAVATSSQCPACIPCALL